MSFARAALVTTVLVAAAAGSFGLTYRWNEVRQQAAAERSAPLPPVTAEVVPVVAAVPTRAEESPPAGEQRQAALPTPPVVPPPQAAPAPADSEPVEEEESADPVIVTPRPGKDAAASRRGITILQIGDSHTSADFLTGELRRRLQARYGRGAPGYITAGKPHIGVRTSSLNIAVSSGWTYKSLQRPDARAAEFWLAGYSANASAAGETMTFSADRPLIFDTIEIEAVAQRGGGSIEIKLDGKVEATQDLDAPRLEPIIIRLLPGRAATEKVREISIVTTKAGAVNLASVAIYNKHSGLTYNSVGYVGATVGLVNKFDSKLFASDLQRLDPQIVVLAFGTNEASNEGLDLAAYGRSYSRVVDRIKEVLPAAVIVVVSPPDFNEMPSHCRGTEASCRRAGDATASITPPATNGSCAWHTPAKLQQIRDVQRDIAKRDGLVYWNWASIMPRECGAHAWFTSTPALMAKDHVHFTIAGYKKSAEEFLATLIPIIEKVRVGANVIPNN
jgi:lysophospholipase L1-like esterase